MLRAADREAHPRICREPGRSPLKVVLKFRQTPAPVQNRESTRVAKPRGPLEEESVPRKPLEEDPVLRAPGRLQKSIWTPGRHQAGKDLWTAWGGTSEQERAIWTAREAPGRHLGQPGRHQGGAREAGKDHLGQPGKHQGGARKAGKDPLDSLGGTREAGKDQLDSLRGTRAAPGRQERTIRTARDAPGRHHARHQGASRRGGCQATGRFIN